MNISDYIVYLWLLPVAVQIVLPLAILCGWSICRLFSRMLLSGKAAIEPTPVAVH